MELITLLKFLKLITLTKFINLIVRNVHELESENFIHFTFSSFHPMKNIEQSFRFFVLAVFAMDLQRSCLRSLFSRGGALEKQYI